MQRVMSRILAGAVALCVSSAFAQTPSNPADYTRTTSYTYASNGVLQTETVEPLQAQLCTTTSYAYDAQGNVTDQTTSNCSGATGTALFAARSRRATFAAVATQAIVANGAPTTVTIAAGTVQTSSTDGLGHPTTYEVDPRFGVVLKKLGPNGVPITVQTDDFGRLIRETGLDGTIKHVAYCILGSSGLDTGSNSPECPAVTVSDAPADAVMLVYTEPRNTSDVKMGAAVKVYRDRLGRVVRTSTESFDGANQPASVASTPTVRDVVFNAFGAEYLETDAYFLSTGSAASSGANAVGVTMTTYDVLGRTTATYRTDPSAPPSHTQTLGGASGVSYGSYGTQRVSQTLHAYAGLTSTITNDAGQVHTEERNPIHELVRVTDASGAQIAFLRDAFGNIVLTKDALQNQIVANYDFRGRQTRLQDPDKGLTRYEFSAYGDLALQESPVQRAARTVTTMVYDALGRLVQRTEPEFVSSWYYDNYADRSACPRGIGQLCESVTTNGLRRRFFYDTAGRQASVRTDVANGPSFAVAQGYDTATGRLISKTYPTGVQVTYAYTARGYTQQLSLATAIALHPKPHTAGGASGAGVSLPVGTVLWRQDAVSAAGATESAALANGVNNKTVFDAMTGRVLASTAGASNAVVNQGYTWDSVGNLGSRTDNVGDGSTGAVTESFAYDNINRLAQYGVSGPGIPALTRTVSLQYNALGMLLSKSDVGNYTYAASGASSVRPHVVQSVAGTALTTYTADANGNISAASGGKYRSLTYTSFDLPDGQAGIAGPLGDIRYTWQYDDRHARLKETRVIATGALAGSRTIWYIHPDNRGGLDFESEDEAPSAAGSAIPAGTSNRHFLSVAGGTIGVLVTTGSLPALTSAQTAPSVLGSTSAVQLEFWHKDHLGSLLATTDHTGSVTARYAYDPFGKRRFSDGNYDANGVIVADWNPATDSGTARGFTGHEGLDDIGLVHMNGRLFDANLGVFLQADPYVAVPRDLQGYNRYGYLMNNPLNGTDPTGYFGETQWLDFTNFLGEVRDWFAKTFSKSSDSTASMFGGSNSQAASPVMLERVLITGKAKDPGTQTFNSSTPMKAGAGVLSVPIIVSEAAAPAVPGVVVEAVVAAPPLMVVLGSIFTPANAGQEVRDQITGPYASQAATQAAAEAADAGEAQGDGAATKPPEDSVSPPPPVPPGDGKEPEEAKKQESTGKSDRHGDQNAMSKAEKQLQKLREELKSAKSNRERQKIEQKIKNITQTAQKRMKGETHWMK
jgi:RHS repeat-associated protein